MSNSSAVILSVENLQQSVAALLANPGAFTEAFGNTLLETITNISNDVAVLNFTPVQISQIDTQLNTATTIINQAIAAGAITIEQVNSLMNLFELVVLKLFTFSFLI